MHRKILYCIVLALSVGLIMPTDGVAQESATIQATATVISAITIIGTNNLRFGTVLPGVDKNVDKASIGFAGEWSITGNTLAEITLDFTLPDSLWLADSTTGMRVGFSSTDVSYDDETGGGQLLPAGTLDPNGPGVGNLGVGGTMLIWIGGTVFPRLTQTGGDYSADVILTVAYTGS